MHSHLGALGVTGFLMKNLTANPLDYVEGGPLNARRLEISRVLDSTNPDLSAFRKRGGKMIVTIGTNDTLASPGAQLDYYQAVIDKMGRKVGRRLRASVRHAADRPRPERNDLHHRRHRQDDSGHADSQSLRSAAAALRLGREEHDAVVVGRRHRGRAQPAALFIPDVSEIRSAEPRAARPRTSARSNPSRRTGKTCRVSRADGESLSRPLEG